MVLLSIFPIPNEGVRHAEPKTEAVIGSRTLGQGVLYVTESCVSWLGTDGRGFVLQYPAISLHAISRDPNAYPKDNLYCMIDPNLSGLVLPSGAPNNGSGDGLDQEEEDDEETEQIAEVRFIPDDKLQLERMFQTMSECQALHPDEDDSPLEEEEGEEEEQDEDYEGEEYGIAPEEGQFYTSEEGFENLNSQGQATLARLNVMLQAGEQQQTSTTEMANGAEPMDTDKPAQEQFEDAPDH